MANDPSKFNTISLVMRSSKAFDWMSVNEFLNFKEYTVDKSYRVEIPRSYQAVRLDPAYLYFVVYGYLEIMCYGPDGSGDDTVQYTVQNGDLLFLDSVLNDKQGLTDTTFLRCKNKSATLIKIPKSVYRAAMFDSTGSRDYSLNMILDMVKERAEFPARLLTLPVRDRVILVLAKELGSRPFHSARRVSGQILANKIGASREMVSRVLTAMRINKELIEGKL